jgi:amino acid adenylation domain-containing protein
MLLQDLFLASVRHAPGKDALVCQGGRHTYGELERQARHLAGALQAAGVQRGDRVALFLPNGVEMVVGVYATLLAGAIFMPVNPQTKTEKLRYILDDSRAVCLITHAALRPTWEGAMGEGTVAGRSRSVIVAGEEASSARSFAGALAAAREPRDQGCIDVDLAAIIYTSGSTGEPKGVMLTHHNMVSAATSVSTYLGLRGDDVIMCALPLSFDYGLYQILMGFQVGARVILEPSFAFPASVLEVMGREQVTVFPGVPTMFAMLMNLEGLSRYDLSTLRAITNTAAALSETQIARLRGLFPKASLFSMYGLTECKRVTYLPPGELDRRPTSVGRGMPNEEVYLTDESGRRLPNGSVGELVVRGSNVMRGYWEKPEETSRRLRPGPYPGEMVLYTGDLFRTDEEGFLYFVARKDDIIKSRGEKVSPREVENAIHALPGVVDVAVVGVDDPVLGQAVKAYVVLAPGVSYSDKDVVRHCHGKLENFMVPKHVEFVMQLPTTHTGKVSKTLLREAAKKEEEPRWT